MGEENKKEVEEGKKKEEKKDEEIVLRVDMHCEACARKVARALRGFEGVEGVTADSKASKVVVKGKAADPQKLCQRIQKKTGRKAEIVSPLPKPPPPPQPENKTQENKETPKQETKEEPPAVVTIVLKVRMHCEACAAALQKRIGKIKGVESVTPDIGKDQILVKGVFDAEKLVNEVYKKTGKHVTLVKDEEKKEEKEEKKEDEKKDEKQDDKKKVAVVADNTKEEDDKKNDAKKMEHWPTKYYMDHAYYAPQLFSDENPNACSVM